MPTTQHILATQKTAAKMLDMSVREFEGLVRAGSLPRPTAFDRWNVEELKRIAAGKPAFDDGGLDL